MPEVRRAGVTALYNGRVSSRIAELLTAVMPEPTVADLPLLQASGMAAWVASRLPTGHPLRAELQAARLALLGRQMVLRRNIATLLAAWNAVGVESVLLKGFMLAEFAYPVPGLRPYGDIDILVRPEQLVSLVQAALAVGWTDDGYSRRPAEWTHEIAHLYSPDGQIRLELHRYTCAWDGGPSGKVCRITEQIWQAAESEVLEGVPVRRPSWADCALILCLGRSWSGDLGRCKPADYTDLLALSERPGVTRRALARRARELGATHTWRTFLAGCDPWRRHFEHGEIHRARKIQWAMLLERSGLPVYITLSRLRRTPQLLGEMWRVLPDVLAVRRSLRLHRRSVGRLTDPRQLVASVGGELPSAPQPLLAEAEVTAVLRGVHWLTRLFYPGSPGDCVPKSLASYRALRQRGVPAVYLSGVRREAGGVVGHAWIEGPGGPLEGYGEPNNRRIYRVVFEVC